MSLDASWPLRVSVLDAAFTLVEYTRAYPDLDIQQAADHLRRGPSELASLDYDRAQTAITTFGEKVFSPGTGRAEALRNAITTIAKTGRPLWATLAKFGRQRSLAAMDPDALQCLRYAGLLASPPPPAVVIWWADLGLFFRELGDEQNAEIGREAEELTLDYERRRLRTIGLGDREPEWASVEDSALGYDVHSWDRDEAGVIHDLFIEVKGTLFSEERFFFTRNQWDVAREYGSKYVVHVWMLHRAPAPRVVKVKELQRHIPHDSGRGLWETVHISLS